MQYLLSVMYTHVCVYRVLKASRGVYARNRRARMPHLCQTVSVCVCVCVSARGRERRTSEGFPGVCKVVVKPRVPSLFRGEMSGGAIVKFCLYMNT